MCLPSSGNIFASSRHCQCRNWEYSTINLSGVPPKTDIVEVLNDAGKDGWELVAVMSNNVAYLRREIKKPASKLPRRKPDPVAPK
jgi:Domain of unknown function (DUF4177)